MTSERSERASIAALTRSARTPGAEISAPARRAFLAKFTDGHQCEHCPKVVIPPDLSADERARRAQAAMRAHMQRIARLSRVARARARQQLLIARAAERQLAEELPAVDAAAS